MKIKLKNLFVIFLSVAIFSFLGFSIIAHADDDDDEYDDDKYEHVVEQVVAPVVQTESAPQVEKPKMITQTITDPPTTVVTDEVRTIELPDSDQDGLIDAEDPHPNMAEIYFVKDDNQNGIVDSFE